MTLAWPDLGERPLRLLGGIAALASCLPMLVMLPAGFASVWGAQTRSPPEFKRANARICRWNRIP